VRLYNIEAWVSWLHRGWVPKAYVLREQGKVQLHCFVFFLVRRLLRFEGREYRPLLLGKVSEYILRKAYGLTLLVENIIMGPFYPQVI
jgi:hypothetical protein